MKSALVCLGIAIIVGLLLFFTSGCGSKKPVNVPAQKIDNSLPPAERDHLEPTIAPRAEAA